MNRNYKIYCVDFDGTLCENKYPEIGQPNMVLIDYLKRKREQGHKLILWTCRCEERLKDAVGWCRKWNLFFDAVNANLPEMIEQFGNDCRKVFADFYIDDRTVDASTICAKPLSIEELKQMTGDKIWVQPPNMAEFGRWATVEGTAKTEREGILYLKDDFTCHQYGECWVAYKES